MAMTYRKKPVEIQAVHYTGSPESLRAVIDMGGAEWDDKVQYNGDGTLTITTLEGDHRANEGDYIIRGVKGELYPCKPDIFASTYEPVCSACDHWSEEGQDCTLVAPDTGCVHISLTLPTA